MADNGLEITGSPALTSPGVDVTPAAAPVPAVEPVVTAAPTAPEPAPTAHSEPTLLESLRDAAKAPDAKPAETATEKPVEAKAEPKVDEKAPETAEKPAEPVVEAPVSYEFKFADNVAPQAEKVAAFTEFAREMKMTPEQAQKAVDYFNDAATSFVQQQEKAQTDAWNDTRREWRNQIMADAEFGGAGFQTSSRAVARMRDELASSAPVGSPRYQREMAEFDNFCRYTGGGDHPALWRLLHNAAAKLDEPKMAPPNPKPVPGNGQRPSNSLYKQPSSSGARQ